MQQMVVSLGLLLTSLSPWVLASSLNLQAGEKVVTHGLPAKTEEIFCTPQFSATCMVYVTPGEFQLRVKNTPLMQSMRFDQVAKEIQKLHQSHICENVIVTDKEWTPPTKILYSGESILTSYLQGYSEVSCYSLPQTFALAQCQLESKRPRSSATLRLGDIVLDSRSVLFAENAKKLRETYGELLPAIGLCTIAK